MLCFFVNFGTSNTIYITGVKERLSIHFTINPSVCLLSDFCQSVVSVCLYISLSALFFCLSVLSICLSVYQYCLSVFLSITIVFISVWMFVYLSICIVFLCVCVYLAICTSVCMSVCCPILSATHEMFMTGNTKPYVAVVLLYDPVRGHRWPGDWFIVLLFTQSICSRNWYRSNRFQVYSFVWTHRPVFTSNMSVWRESEISTVLPH